MEEFVGCHHGEALQVGRYCTREAHPVGLVHYGDYCVHQSSKMVELSLLLFVNLADSSCFNVGAGRSEAFCSWRTRGIDGRTWRSNTQPSPRTPPPKPPHYPPPWIHLHRGETEPTSSFFVASHSDGGGISCIYLCLNQQWKRITHHSQ